MSGIKFNQLTKEIEMRGSESFIESNFNKVWDLMVRSFAVEREGLSREAKTGPNPVSVVDMKEYQITADITGHESSEASPMSLEAKSSIPEIPRELVAKRPPLRKYIRREGIPGAERIVIQVAEQKPNEISIPSLKEKFGLSESKIGGIIRDAEKLGKIRRTMNGSYVWAQD
jgi:hypothetical protein